MNDIDHVAEARKLLASAAVNPFQPRAAIDRELAAVHANLALVEQHRLANILAVAESHWTGGNGANVSSTQAAYTGWRATVEKALGLA